MRERILQISQEKHLSHIGSCLGMAEVLNEIYQLKKPEDIVILDAGHAHLAHLVAREKYEGLENIKALIERDVHCNRESGCYVNSGSLGLAFGLSIGIALAKREKNIYVVVSDGGSREGIFFEGLRIAKEQKLTNLKVYLNCNGFGGLGEIDTNELERQISGLEFPVNVRRTNSGFDNVTGVEAHYKVL